MFMKKNWLVWKIDSYQISFSKQYILSENDKYLLLYIILSDNSKSLLLWDKLSNNNIRYFM